MATEKLGPLRAVLRAIRAVYGDREVRLRSLFQNYPLTNASSGSRGGAKQDRGPPFTYIFVGNVF